MKRAIVFISFGLFLLSVAAIADEPSKARPERSPESVARAFMAAFLANDEAAIRQVILPAPDAEVLWQGPARSPQDVLQAKAMLQKSIFRECRVGQTLDIPGEEKLEVTESVVNENRKVFLVLVDGKPIAPRLTLCLAEGEWKVDASDIISQVARAKRIEKVAHLARACLSYSDKNQGRIPSSLSVVKNRVSDIDLKAYEIVVQGKMEDYRDRWATVLVREKKEDANGDLAAGYLDGSARFQNPKEEEAARAKGVRVVCNVCGAWSSCSSSLDERVDEFSATHLAKCGAGKIGMVISIVYPSDERFEALKDADKVK